MHIIMLSWIKGAPVPPKGCSGIERMVGILSAELVKQGHQVTLIAPPGSSVENCAMIETTDLVETANICNMLKADVIHDHTCWSLESPVRQGLRLPHISTTHVMHAIGYTKNVVYVSKSQRTQHGIQVERNLNESPVVYVPINPELKPKGFPKETHLLYLGRIIEYKGVYEAAQVADYLGRPLIIAGPITNSEYEQRIKRDFRNAVFVGEVDDPYRSELLETAYAVMACFNDQGGWQEPGCGVFGEAMTFGTPVAAFNNGCLTELVYNGYNGWIANDVEGVCREMKHFPTTRAGIANAAFKISAELIVHQYVSLYEQVCNGITWG